MLRSILFSLLFCCLQLHARNKPSDFLLDQMRLELADVKHELKTTSVELDLLDERIRKQEQTASSQKGIEGKELIAQIAALDRKIVQLEKLLEKASGDLQKLSGQTLSRIHTLEQEIASHEKRLDDVAKLKGTLNSISRAMETKPSDKTYRVKAGDSLEKIARNHQITLSDLKRLNRLQTDKIMIGQELKLSDDTE